MHEENSEGHYVRSCRTQVVRLVPSLSETARPMFSMQVVATVATTSPDQIETPSGNQQKLCAASLDASKICGVTNSISIQRLAALLNCCNS